MKRKAIALIGVPAVGKTTIMRQFLKRINAKPQKVGHIPLLRSTTAVVLGVYDEGETFAGTDRMSMSIQPKVEEFLSKEWKGHVVFEGDRLGNLSFFRYVSKLPDTDLFVFVVTAKPETVTARHHQRKDCQTQTFLQSRATKVNNLKGGLAGMAMFSSNVTLIVRKHETAEDTASIVKDMLKLVE